MIICLSIQITENVLHGVVCLIFIFIFICKTGIGTREWVVSLCANWSRLILIDLVLQGVVGLITLY